MLQGDYDSPFGPERLPWRALASTLFVPVGGPASAPLRLTRLTVAPPDGEGRGAYEGDRERGGARFVVEGALEDGRTVVELGALDASWSDGRLELGLIAVSPSFFRQGLQTLFLSLILEGDPSGRLPSSGAAAEAIGAELDMENLRAVALSLLERREGPRRPRSDENAALGTQALVERLRSTCPECFRASSVELRDAVAASPTARAASLFGFSRVLEARPEGQGFRTRVLLGR